jgi:hypothetical protein
MENWKELWIIVFAAGGITVLTLFIAYIRFKKGLATKLFFIVTPMIYFREEAIEAARNQAQLGFSKASDREKGNVQFAVDKQGSNKLV